jgi:hypothetical protein
MTFQEFSTRVERSPEGVVLLEGRRSIPAGDAVVAEKLARGLALKFSRLCFRSGNAAGSDEAFSGGVASVNPSRLEIVAPYAAHRKNERHAGAIYTSPEILTPEQARDIESQSIQASPQNRRIIGLRGKKGPLGAKGDYLVRDTMKVVGVPVHFAKPICALFFVNLADATEGGTGHTIRVCQQEGVPVTYQDEWGAWEV